MTTHNNPGALDAYSYVPDDLPDGAPLVVVLHGCTQTADGYDVGTGWSHLADRAGFALLFPEQRRANNANLCFNWFQPSDIVRHGGEAESIAQMAEAMVAAYGLDRGRIFVTGLSAGGAMAAVMLATYPDLFAGGAIVGGLPYGCADGVGAALERMRSNDGVQAGTDAVVRASGLSMSRWPTVSIWHGAADRTVVIGNMDALAAQWCGVHGVNASEADVECGATWQCSRWSKCGRVVVETWCIPGMGHGVPIDPSGAEQLGSVGPYMLNVGVDSTAMIARSWELIPNEVVAAAPSVVAPPKRAGVRAKPIAVPTPPARAAKCAPGIQGIIEDALRSAGLMK